MLDLKIRRAAQAIIKNNSLIIASGSGMTAECPLIPDSPTYEGNKIPILRGTHGLWKNYPAMRKKMILFDDLVESSFFKEKP